MPRLPSFRAAGKSAALAPVCLSLLLALGLAWAALDLRLMASRLREELGASERERGRLVQVVTTAEAAHRRAARELADCRLREGRAASEAASFESEARRYHQEATKHKQIQQHAEEMQAASLKAQTAELQQACDLRVANKSAALERCHLQVDQQTEEVAQVSASLEQLQKAMLEKVAIVSEMNKTALAAQQRADSLRVAAARQGGDAARQPCRETLGAASDAMGPAISRDATMKSLRAFETLAMRLMHGVSQHSGKKGPWGHLPPVYPKEPTFAAPSCRRIVASQSALPVVAMKEWAFQVDSAQTGTGMGYAHMAMLSSLPPASPWEWILVWQAANKVEGGDDQVLMASFSLDGRAWTDPLKMPGLRSSGCIWSPVLHRTAAMVWLFYTESVSCLRPANKVRGIPPRWAPGGTLKYVQSKDGVVWSSPVTVLEQWRDGGVPKVIANQLAVHHFNGTERWALPYWQEMPILPETTPGCPPKGENSAGVLLSSNRGKTWRKSAQVKMEEEYGLNWLIEGTAVQLENGTLFQMFRTKTGGIFGSMSNDGGAHWTQAKPVGLPNPNSKVNMIRIKGGGGGGTSDMLALAYNHNETIGARNNLRVALSADMGRTWHMVAELEGVPEDGAMYHYPTMAQDGCRLLIAYSVYYQLISKCSLSNPVCPPERPRGAAGIRVAELDLAAVDLTAETLIPPTRVRTIADGL